MHVYLGLLALLTQACFVGAVLEIARAEQIELEFARTTQMARRYWR